MTTRNRVLLILFAYITWIYRLTVFIGIALLVYHLVLKLLGIFLMLVEVVWFILRPFTSEAAYLWGRRKEIRIAWGPMAGVGVVMLFLLWVLPVSRQVTAPAVLRALNDQAIHAPFAAQLRAVRVSSGQTVEPGTVLAVLDSPELLVRWRQAEGSIASVQAELQRAPASVRQQEQQSVLQEQLAQALAEQVAVNEDADRLELRATSAGVVRDLAPDLVVGRWVNQRQQLMRIVSGTSRVIELYVTESQVGAVKEGQELRFYPSVPEDPVLTGIVRVVDRTPSRAISQPLLASTYGGEVAAVKDPKEGLIAYDAMFRVLASPEDRDFRSLTVQRGTARIDTDLRLVMENFVSRIIGLFIRESGF
jgi:putative peptide zinc metalloprotease protein